jgi:hypothetical protein
MCYGRNIDAYDYIFPTGVSSNEVPWIVRPLYDTSHEVCVPERCVPTLSLSRLYNASSAPGCDVTFSWEHKATISLPVGFDRAARTLLIRLIVTQN